MTMAAFIRGKPIMQDYDPGATAVAAGDVIVIGDLPCVAHCQIPAFTGATTKDALAVGGGIYQMTADAAIPTGEYVYWDPTNSKVTQTSGGNCVPFGWIVGGANDVLSDSGPVSSAYVCSVLHEPAPGGSSLVYNLGAAASDTITNTNADTAFATTTIIPAGSLVAGDVVTVKVFAKVTGQNSTNTHLLKLKISTAANTFTTVIATAATNAAANTLAVIEADLIFTAVGASGSFYAAGAQGFGAAPAPADLVATNCNTALAITVEATSTASAASTSNVIQLLELNVVKKRK